MSSHPDRSAVRAAERAHERAHTLASESLDVDLSASDAAWLKNHLAGCDACRDVAAEYQAIHAELRGLAMPVPPRDLWARTAAALDHVDAAHAGRAAGRGPLRLGFLPGSRMSLATAVAVGLTVVVACLSLFSQGPGLPFGPGPNRTAATAAGTAAPNGGFPPVAFVDGNIIRVTATNGVYQITSASASCSGAQESCSVSDAGSVVVGSIASRSPVSVALAPNAAQAAVWTGDKVVIVPLGAPSAKTVPFDLLTPRPTGSAAASEVAPTAQASFSVEPTAGSSATPTPTASLLPTQPPTVASEPIAILDGYQIVGRAPEFSADGVWVAFSARPAQSTVGADVYVWRAGWEAAARVTDTHADLFAGWYGPKILISEFVSVPAATEPTPSPTAEADASEVASTEPTAVPAPIFAAVSFVYDPLTRAVSQIDRYMLLPTVDPTGRYLVYWSGSVRLNPATNLWEAGQGDLYFDSWSNVDLLAGKFGESAIPAAFGTGSSPAVGAEGQVLPVTPTPGSVQRWVVRWDAVGRYVAIWVGDPSGESGRVSLFGVDPATGRLDPTVLISAEARSNVAFDESSNLVYSAPSKGGDGKTYIVPIPQPTPTPTASPTMVPTPAQSAEAQASVAPLAS
jgi:hypothetical protein